MILYFLRHGLASDRNTWQEDDRLRPLTEEGKARLARQADSFARLRLNLDAILTSPLTRAQQTAAIVAQHLKLNDSLVEDERLAPGFDLEQLQAILASYPKSNNMMLVGHEPDFSETIAAVIGGGRLVCKKAGLARVDLFSKSPPQGDLLWLIPPKLLIF